MSRAFQADFTRISTFMMSRELNSRTYPQIGVPDQHHSVSHHQYNPVQMEKDQKINTYHVQLFAKFLDKLQNSPDGEGSLLDHTMILYGSGMGDGNVHSHDPISVLLGGGAAGQRQDRPPHPKREGNAHGEPAAHHDGNGRHPPSIGSATVPPSWRSKASNTWKTSTAPGQPARSSCFCTQTKVPGPVLGISSRNF